MRIVETTQLCEAELAKLPIDIFVGATGYEERCIHALSRLNSDHIHAKLALGFTDRIDERRRLNNQFFEAHGADIADLDGDCLDCARAQFEAKISACPGDEVNLFIDYSSMTRSWYAGAIQAITGMQAKKRLVAYFSYSPAEFEDVLPTAPNAIAEPINGFCSLEAPDRPSALIVGLGYEKERALGLLEYVDPALSFAFYTDPAIDPRFRNAVLKNNKDVLALIPSDHVFTHPLGDLQRTGDLLLSLCCALRTEYRVILAPLGVKPFSLICLLLATRFPDIDVWRVTSGRKALPQIRPPCGRLVVLKAVFEPSSIRE